MSPFQLQVRLFREEFFPDFGIAPEAKNHCKFITVQFCFQE